LIDDKSAGRSKRGKKPDELGVSRKKLTQKLAQSEGMPSDLKLKNKSASAKSRYNDKLEV